MGFVSRRDSDRVLLRLRRNEAALLLAGGRLPRGHAWIERIEAPHGVPQPGAWRWQVVSPSGWSNIGSRWPVRLVMNSREIHFRPQPEGYCSVEVTP